jgi:hypothetical protein
MTRHNAESIGGVVVLLACGTGLTFLSHRWGVGGNHMSQLAACFGPMAVVLGVGMVIHGVAMPLNRISLAARFWGIVGSLAGAANLWDLGYFQQGGPAGRAVRLLMPVALVGAWLLPARFYGETPEGVASGVEPR